MRKENAGNAHPTSHVQLLATCDVILNLKRGRKTDPKRSTSLIYFLINTCQKIFFLINK